jgi:hypothetical protein
MDFITDLPPSSRHSYDAVLVVVCRLTKMAHFIPCTKTTTAEATARLVLDHVVKLHGLPDDIVSDRGPQFASRFWARFFELIGTKINLSSAFHPQSNGQAERTNQTLEQYLRCYVDYKQTNWADLLALAEFAYNNGEHASTGMSPFYATYGFHPRFSPSVPSPQSINPVAESRVQDLHRVHNELQLQLRASQARAKHHADKSRQPTPASLRPGAKVWLLRRNIKTTRPCAKLDYKRLGPFEIARQVNPVAFELRLPPTWKIHNVFHASLLEPYSESARPWPASLDAPPPEPIEVEGETEYEVEDILDCKRVGRSGIKYLVKWKGYPISEATWEPFAHVRNASDLVQDYHRRHPDKPASPGGSR